MQTSTIFASVLAWIGTTRQALAEAVSHASDLASRLSADDAALATANQRNLDLQKQLDDLTGAAETLAAAIAEHSEAPSSADVDHAAANNYNFPPAVPASSPPAAPAPAEAPAPDTTPAPASPPTPEQTPTPDTTPAADVTSAPTEPAAEVSASSVPETPEAAAAGV